MDGIAGKGHPRMGMAGCWAQVPAVSRMPVPNCNLSSRCSESLCGTLGRHAKKSNNNLSSR
eukprot:11125943-Alexandrium_andersonii.AAC.1